MSAAKNNVAGAKRRTTPARKPSRRKEDEVDMSVILRNVPPGYHWGWFSREDQRMHLQTVDREHAGLYKVWLERAGRRVFEPEGKIPPRIVNRLEEEVEKLRRHIEARWVNFMIDNRWLQLKTAGTKVSITAYGHVPGRFTRTFDLRDFFRPEALAQIGLEDVVLSRELPAIEVWPNRAEDRRHHIWLGSILWQE